MYYDRSYIDHLFLLTINTSTKCFITTFNDTYINEKDNKLYLLFIMMVFHIYNERKK